MNVLAVLVLLDARARQQSDRNICETWGFLSEAVPDRC